MGNLAGASQQKAREFTEMHPDFIGGVEDGAAFFLGVEFESKSPCISFKTSRHTATSLLVLQM